MVSIALLSLAAVATASSQFNWKPCPDNPDTRLQCGALKVPLDHLNASNRATIDIAVRRYRSSSSSPKGTILLNPGGPGGSGIGMASPAMLTLTGGEYDVLGFDPRGVGSSKPVTCAESAYAAIVEERKRNAKPVPFEEVGGETSLERYEVDYELWAKRCIKFEGEYLKYLSTSYVARDMDLIREALGESVLNYYGISYGTFLGATYVSMFPDRVGRVVIDSVLDPKLYLESTPKLMSDSLLDTDAVFEGFCTACEEAGQEYCVLADDKAKRPYLSKRLRGWFAELARKPLIVASGNDFTTVTGQDIRKQLFGKLPMPMLWPDAAAWLHSFISGSASEAAPAASCETDNFDFSGGDTQWVVYVSNDGNNSATSPKDWEHHLKKCQSLSPLSGGSWYVNALVAKFWTVKPVERYVGPWNKKLRNPILILNNHFDPATPLAHAEAVADALGRSNAVLVSRDGFGHWTFGQPSECLHDIFVNFWNNGVLPPHKTNCGVDGNPFVPIRPNVRTQFDEVKHAMKSLATIRYAKNTVAAVHTKAETPVERSVWERIVDGVYTVVSVLALL